MNVQAFVTNISFPKTIEQLDVYINKGWFDVEDVTKSDSNYWTVPKWACIGDIVFFFHAKTAITWIRHLMTLVDKSSIHMNYLTRAEELYKQFGGKIFAVGKIADKAHYDNEWEDEDTHFVGRIFADVDCVFTLDSPIDISEFNHQLAISRQSTITPVLGNDFDLIKELISKKNKVPEYFKNSEAVPMPLMKINEANFLEVTKEYRRSFFLEMQFRKYYVDYFIRYLGDQKTYWSECNTYRNGCHTGRVDNVIKVNGKFVPVEVKLNIASEVDFEGQCEQYCNLDIVDLGKGKKEKRDIVQSFILVIDRENFGIYETQKKSWRTISKLNDINTVEDILKLKQMISDKM